MEFNMKRNASGYYDETAYKGIMSMAKAGEIYETGTKSVLIIKNHGKHCSALTLLERKNGDNCIEIRADKIYYTDPSMLQYVYTDYLGQSVAVLPSDSFTAVVEEIELALCLDIGRKKALADASRRIRELEAELSRPAETTDDGIYKRLYEDIINKLIDKKVM